MAAAEVLSLATLLALADDMLSGAYEAEDDEIALVVRFFENALLLLKSVGSERRAAIQSTIDALCGRIAGRAAVEGTRGDKEVAMLSVESILVVAERLLAGKYNPFEGETRLINGFLFDAHRRGGLDPILRGEVARAVHDLDKRLAENERSGKKRTEEAERRREEEHRKWKEEDGKRVKTRSEIAIDWILSPKPPKDSGTA